MKKQQTRKVVQLINKRVYVLLYVYYFWKTKRILFSKKMSDRVYEDALIFVFSKVKAEDWQEYMRVIQKMHYSKEELSQEEMTHCYVCYKKITS